MDVTSVRERWQEFSSRLGLPRVRDFYEWDRDCLQPLPDELRREYEAYALALSGEAGDEHVGGPDFVRQRARELAGHADLERRFYQFLLSSPALQRAAIAGRLNLYESLVPEMVARLSQHTTWRLVLDVGSFAGLVSCFLAWLFPESLVVGLEREPSWALEARRLAARLRLRNVRFVAGQWENFPGHERFTTLVWLLVSSADSRRGRRMARFLHSHLAGGGAAAVIERWEEDRALELFLRAVDELGMRVVDRWIAWWRTAAELDLTQRTIGLLLAR